MECIICQDTGSEPLQDNIGCSCKYKQHPSCWIDYVHSREKVICPLCRKDLTLKKAPKTNSSLYRPLMESIPRVPVTTVPYTPQIHSVPEESGRQITYQEFIDTIQQYNTTHTAIEVRPSVQPLPPQTKIQQIVKLVICVIILIAFIVLIWLFSTIIQNTSL